MTDKRTVLDHGYVELVESWGSDEAIICAARMSTSKGFQGWGPVTKCRNCGALFDGPETPCLKPTGRPYVDSGRGGHVFEDMPGDEKLLRYLWDHKHATPFEMAGATFEIKAPIMVFREWMRHRTQSYSEVSGRYVMLPNENYAPDLDDLLDRSQAVTTNRQATGSGAVLTESQAAQDLLDLDGYYARGQELYEQFLAHGWPKELARLPVPVARYSRMRASANLRNWIGYLMLRCDAAAQAEIRRFAYEVRDMLAGLFPRTMQLFNESKGV